MKRNGEFTVNIAHIDEHRAVLGVVLAPVLDRMYSGARARRMARPTQRGAPQPNGVPATATTPLRVVGSRSHPTPELADYLAAVPAHEITDMGSSLKICLVAEGAADIIRGWADVRMGHGRRAGYPRKCGRAYD